jgi:anthranilate 1,2-dioxygenase large subunit
VDTHSPSPPFRSWPLDPTRVPAWIYTDQSVFDREMAVLFGGRTWNYVGLECEIPEPGSYKRSWIGNRSIVVTRDISGGVHAMENRCSHRGTPLCWQERGTAKDLTCPYHHWRFELNGELASVPFQRGFGGKGGMDPGFDRSDHGLHKLTVYRRGGAIWASVHKEPPDFEVYCGPELLANVDRLFSGKPLRLIGYSRQLIPCNWKLYWENSRDSYHATLMHTFFVLFGLFRADGANTRVAALGGGQHASVSSTFVGQKAAIVDASEMTRLDSRLHLNDMEMVTPRQEFSEIAAYGVQVFPSVFMQTNMNSLLTRQVVPRDPENVELIWTFFGFADDDEELQRLRLKQANLVGPAGFVSMDDSEVLAEIQRAVSKYPEAEGVLKMGGSGTEPTDTMLTEAQLRGFYQFYRTAMGFA